MPTYAEAIAETVKDDLKGLMETEWEDILFYSQMFLALPRKQQKVWVDKMEEKWNQSPQPLPEANWSAGWKATELRPRHHRRMMGDVHVTDVDQVLGRLIVEYCDTWKHYVAWQHYKNLYEGQ
jgi:hypothetical protein